MRQRALIVLVVVLATLVTAGFVAVRLLTPRTQGVIVTWLIDQFGGRATVGAIQWSIRPHLQITAHDVQVMNEALSEAPLVAIQRVTIETTVSDLLATPRRIGLVRLRGLVVRVPPRKSANSPTDVEPRANAQSRGTASAEIERIVAEATKIEILSSRTEKPPLVFDVHDLSLEGIAPGKPMRFVAQLTNPKPIGEVATSGTLGPWNKGDAGATAIQGKFRFANADLSSLRGLEGVLQSGGIYSGSIAEIHATGSADIADFTLTGRPVSLKTRYDVLVGGTTGDVALQPVEVAVGESELTSVGAVVRARDVKGRRIDMNVTAANAKIEDILQLALKADPSPLSGAMELATNLRIEPSEAPVIRRLRLDGRFTIRRARFANTDIQKTLARVSRFTGGEAVEGENGSGVAANLMGRFTMNDGNLNFSSISFDVPGTAVKLAGSYRLDDGALDLRGTIRVARSVADVVPPSAAGWLETLGRLDRRLQIDTSGTTIPVTIQGTREKPVFRVDATALKRNWRRAIGVGGV